MAKLNDLTGRVFGRLKVIRHVGSNRFAKALWWCLCACGADCLRIGSSLLSGHAKSCGCLKAEGKQPRHGARTGAVSTRAYSAWCNLRSRCTSRSDPAWHNYGGRGITYSKSWEKFENFLRDMGEPKPGMSLDRRDNDKGYSRANCRWTDRVTQRRNSRSHVVWLTIDRKRMILKDAVAKCRVVSYATAVNRVHLGWTPKDAVLTPYTRSDNKGYRPMVKVDASNG
jgi:hypothetical protein